MSTTAVIACLFVVAGIYYVMGEVEHRVKRLREDHDDLIKTVDDLQARVYDLRTPRRNSAVERPRATGCRRA